MSRLLKTFLGGVAHLCLIGGPLLGVVAIAAAFLPTPDSARVTVGLMTGVYVTFLGLLIGGVLRLLLSIDDRLERLEQNR
ncbi:hypothetical protein Q0812_08050 [Brevundimonas sp. 2R-24]|uniref:Uncharacterized protein n=1 Tax=Peiella sedimenti TaxID=3061083 RepID=A0ABT8SLF0_9CAUL|nr:hypothetical protein [Caulobacteraceae bacterium XZ-24]